MQKFRYEAVAMQAASDSWKLGSGRPMRGEVSASDELHALEQLAGRGLHVLRLQAVGLLTTESEASERLTNLDLNSTSAGFGLRRRITQEALSITLYEMATLLEAGVPLADAVRNLADAKRDQPSSQRLSLALAAIHARLRAGALFSTSLEESTRSAQIANGVPAGVSVPWPRYVVELARAGEMTGKLPASLRSAAEQMEQDVAFAREARNALIYPSVLVVSGILATLLVFVFVVPKFASVLNNPKAQIPAFSAWILQTGIWLGANRLALGAVALLVAAALWWASAQSAFRQAIWDAASHLPVAKGWVQHSELARWGTMFSVLLQNSVPILEALGLARGGLRASKLREKADWVSQDVRAGKSLHEAMQAHAFADATSTNLVAVGERSGALPRTALAMANMHRTASQQALKRFLVLLEPITILLISVVLGSVMISVMLAVTSLTNVI